MVVRGSACEAASWTSRSGTPASSAAVMDAFRRGGGVAGLGVGAVRAVLRTIRPPPCRSSRPPSLARNTGPSVRSPDGQVDRPGGPRRQRDGDDLAALAGDGESPVAALEAQMLDVG